MASLKILLVTPLSGPLALFGRASAQGLRLWATVADLPAPWQTVELDIRDSGSDPAAALQAGLVTQPDVVFGPYGSSPMLAVARASDRVVWNHGGASAGLTRQAFPGIINVISPATAYFKGVLQAVRAHDASASSVACFHSTTGFGRDIAAGVQASADELNFTVQFIPFAPAQAAALVERVPAADILLVAGNFADEQAVAPALVARAFRYAAFVGAGVEEVLAELGEKRAGLLGPAQWIPTVTYQPDEGPDANWFVTKYRATVGVDPPYPAAQAFATGLLCARCLRDSGSCDDAAQLAAARQLVCTTLYGGFQLDPTSGLQSGHQVLIVQWQQGRLCVVWPPEHAERPLHPTTAQGLSRRTGLTNQPGDHRS